MRHCDDSGETAAKQSCRKAFASFISEKMKHVALMSRATSSNQHESVHADEEEEEEDANLNQTHTAVPDLALRRPAHLLSYHTLHLERFGDEAQGLQS
ncbi:uncharacterized [Tachysurus ichikawai]